MLQCIRESAAMLMHEVGHAVSRAASRTQFADVATARAALEAASNAFNEGQKQYTADAADYAKSKDPELRKSLDARAAATQDDVAKVKALQKTWQDLQAAAKSTLAQGSAMEQAYLAKLPLAAAPTLYGRTAGPEAFAEAFRLWKFDRVALDRAAPGMAAWFDAQAPRP